MARLITISALLRYAKEAKEAENQLNDAKQQMKHAAEELCSKWKGDAAQAFAEEQGVLDSWFEQLIRIGSTYIAAIEKAAKDEEENEAELASKISG